MVVGCVAGGSVAGGCVVPGGAVVGSPLGTGVGAGVVASADGPGTLAATVDGLSAVGFGVCAPDDSSALLLLPRVPNSTSRPATIATTASTATRDERTWPLSPFGRDIFRPRYPNG